MFDRDALRTTGDALAARVPEMAARLRRLLRDSVPTYDADSDPALAAVRSERITAALESLVDAIRGGSEPGNAVLTAAAVEARATAQAGIDLDALIQTYRVLQATVWDDVLAETTRPEWDAAAQLELQKYLSALHFRWSDTMVAAVVESYQAEQRTFFYQSRDRRLRSALREMLAGHTDRLTHCDYPLDGTHTAAVIWGDQRRGTVDGIAAAAGARAVLSVDGSSGTTLAWFATPTPTSVHFEPADGAFAALGNAATGASGFRSSHHQAWRAYRVGRMTGAAVVRYRDVALESLFLQNPEAARDLVNHQLGPLDLGDPRTEVLCETIRTYFACGCNAAKAAAQLQIHERTVAYRLRTVEDRLGVDVIHRRDELVTALRLLPALRANATAL